MIETWIATALRWWQALGHEAHYLCWQIGGPLLLLLLAFSGYRVLRQIAGHRKFRGTWYGAAEFEALVATLMEDHQQGRRVMRSDELKIIRSRMLGKGFKPLYAKDRGGYL